MMKKTLAAAAAMILAGAIFCGPAMALDHTGTAEEGTVADAVANIRFTGGNADGDCTGTAIAPRWVVTARHCIEGLADTSGTVMFGQGDNRRTVAVDFTEPAPANDIALMHTTQDIGLDQYPALGSALKSGDTGEFYGWSASGIGKTGKLPVAKASVAEVSAHPLYGEGDALHIALANKATSQPGDSGGPFMKDSQLIGVGSVAIGGGEESNTAAIVPIDLQKDWITSRIATPDDKVQPPTEEELRARGVDVGNLMGPPHEDLPAWTMLAALALLIVVAGVFYRLRK